MKLITAALILEQDLVKRLILALRITAAERYGKPDCEIIPEYIRVIEAVLYDKFLARGKLDFCLGTRSFRTLKIIEGLPHIHDHSNFYCADYSSVFSIGGSEASPRLLSIITDTKVYLYPDQLMLNSYLDYGKV